MNKLLYFFLFALPVTACSSNPQVRISTTVGTIDVEIYAEKAPITANNFFRYVDNKLYDNQACFYRAVRMDNQPHNKIKIEVIQGGLYFFDSLRKKMAYPQIAHETTRQTGILHKNGVISMARTKPGSATSEFFICINDQPELDFGGKRNPDGQGFAAFGKVIKGMEVIKKIQAMKDKEQTLVEHIKIISMKRI